MIDKYFKKGISIITLIIVIIVMLILIGTVLVTINNNTINNAMEAVIRQDLSNMIARYNQVYVIELGKVKGIKENINWTEFNDVIPQKYKSDFEVTKEGIEYNCNDKRITKIIKDMSKMNKILILNCEKGAIPIIRRIELASSSDTINITVDYSNSVSGVNEFIYYISEDEINWREYKEIVENKVINGLIKDTEYKVKVKLIDQAKHEVESEINSIKTKIVEMPIIEAVDTEWRQSKEVVIKYPNENINKKQYSYDGITWIDSISENNIERLMLIENKTVYARCLDKNNNESGVTTVEVTKIDTVEPVISSVTTTNATSNSITVNISATDSASGIVKYKYSVDDGTTYIESTSASYNFTNLKSSTNLQIKVQVIDKAGNIAEKSGTGSTAAVPAPTIDTIDTSWTQSKTVTIRYPATGIAKKQYSYDGITWTDSTVVNNIQILTLNENKTVYARCLDANNNESSVASVAVTKIDTIAPVISSVTTTNVTSNSITVNVAATDASSGISKYKYSIDNGANYIESTSSSYKFTGLTPNKMYSLVIYVIDNVGNISNRFSEFVTTEAIKIDGVIIPNGFYYVGGTKDSGLVISDNIADSNKGTSFEVAKTLIGNQYVWIPVATEADFARKEWNMGIKVNECVEPDTSGYLTEVSEYNDMKSSVIKNKGFYIARYQASNNNGKAESKAVKMPWEVSWNNVGTTPAELVPGTAPYEGRHAGDKLGYKSVQSTLVYGVQWDNALKFIEKTGANMQNPVDWGNYRNTTFDYTNIDGTISKKEYLKETLVPTGSAERNMKQNIYDMSGNSWVWTMEAKTNTLSAKRIVRSGEYDVKASDYPAIKRGESSLELRNASIRVALYIK